MTHRATTYDTTYALVASLAAAGVGQFVISPGSRSTVLAVCADLSEVNTVIVHDERSAAFLALGWTRATGIPSALICTSGTAAANYLPAMVEAAHSGVPLIALTADRPPEVRGFGAGQTIDQVKLYGYNVVWYHELPVMNECPPM
ncbi:MAG: 2-succinyl-5-enolpyruvyl-6-hydroxy-3-cyclohexene-1-carboxylate synthase, partial [Acidobacteria bacterium]|nr:2-succinyl-5-enolpyruvyl-6-hydroxy-3-cyclohexene-1-carboxylate synthase [Acidobacteriota bacterium]